MLFGLIESKYEKELRVLKSNIQDSKEREEAYKNNNPYFGSQYVE